jgi:hypothetical protein
MRPDLDIELIADGLLSTMPGMRLVRTVQSTGEFRVAGSIPDRSILVCHEPAGVDRYWELEVTLEVGLSTGPVSFPTPYRLLASGRCQLYAIALSWLAPGSEWPHGEARYKVTAKQIRGTTHDGLPWIVPLDLWQPLPNEYRGLYQMPQVFQGVVSSPEDRVKELLLTWIGMGWRVGSV